MTAVGKGSMAPTRLYGGGGQGGRMVMAEFNPLRRWSGPWLWLPMVGLIRATAISRLGRGSRSAMHEHAEERRWPDVQQGGDAWYAASN